MKPTKNRYYCFACQRVKMLFDSKEKADNYIRFNKNEFLDKSKCPVRSYYCTLCQGWHVTSLSSEFASKFEDHENKIFKTIDIYNRQNKIINKFFKKYEKEKAREEKQNCILMQQKSIKEERLIWKKSDDGVKYDDIITKLRKIRRSLRKGDICVAETFYDDISVDLYSYFDNPYSNFLDIVELEKRRDEIILWFIILKQVINDTKNGKRIVEESCLTAKIKNSISLVLDTIFKINDVKERLVVIIEKIINNQCDNLEKEIEDCSRIILAISLRKTKNLGIDICNDFYRILDIYRRIQ